MGKMYKALRIRNGRAVRDVVAFVDSGCDKTIISDRVAKSLRTKRFGSEDIEMANAEVITVDLGHVTVISINDKLDSEMEVGISDIPFQIDPDENIDMIIGVDFLQENNIKLIFEK